MAWRPVGQAPAGLRERPVVVGFGPCGIFAALVLAQMGFRPIVLERGKTVRERTKDTWGLWRKHELNPESNVQFGEGGAGTFSDGKLYSQIKDPRHLGRKVMQEFVKAGAPPEILYVAHPHIGTFKLVKVVENAARADHRAGWRDPLRAARDRCADRADGKGQRHLRGLRCSTRPRARPTELAAAMWCWRWATARATPLPCCTSAACTCRPSRSRWAFASSTRRA
jgi:choline dehydrogenase-like flavoprotein